MKRALLALLLIAVTATPAVAGRPFLDMANNTGGNVFNPCR